MIDTSKLSPEEKAIRLAKREYARKWRKANPEKSKEYINRYWKKKATEVNKNAKE